VEISIEVSGFKKSRATSAGRACDIEPPKVDLTRDVKSIDTARRIMNAIVINITLMFDVSIRFANRAGSRRPVLVSKF